MSERGYAILEIQGAVSKVPEYDAEKDEIAFCISPSDGISIHVFASGELAKGLKSVITIGTLLIAKAVPKQYVLRFEGYKWLTTDFEIRRVKVLRKQSKFSLRRAISEAHFTLDSLMPDLSDFEDVGYVDDVTWNKFMEHGKKAKGQKGGEHR